MRKETQQAWYDQEFPREPDARESQDAEHDPTNRPLADVSRGVDERQGVKTIEDIQTLIGQERPDALIRFQHRWIKHAAP